VKIIVLDGKTRVLGRNEALILLLRKHEELERARRADSFNAIRRQSSRKSTTLKAA
jgi:hypothetical protein